MLPGELTKISTVSDSDAWCISTYLVNAEDGDLNH